MSKRFWFEDSVYVTVSPTDCIPHISTNVLEKELTERLEDKISDPENFNKEERERGGEFSVAIDPEDYNLIDKDDITLEDFTANQIIDHIERKEKVAVVPRNETFGCIDNVVSYLQNLPKYKFRDFMCDVLELSRLSSNEEITNTLKRKI